MKVEERKKAIKLRQLGVPMGQIASELGVAKSTVSYWVRDVPLSRQQQKTLKNNSHTRHVIERRRASRLRNTERRRMVVKERALENITTLLRDPLWCIGVALYWGEGGKTQQTVRIANSDPAVIKTMMRFFREVCHIPETKFRAHVHTFSNANVMQAETYWSQVADIDKKRFYKTYVKKSAASKNKRNTLPYGTVQIYVHDSEFFFTLLAWIDYLKEHKL
jgi:hypothetical protein